MVSAPGTSAKPTMAAFPVSPDVAVKMTILFSKPCFLAAVVIKYGKIDKAMSLKAIVEPWKSSKLYWPSSFTRGAMAGVSNLSVHS